ncbi:MAG: hypothetical protein MZW92_11390 [Comamonadaceae bacterium]|nr:hypothetical protein [Comamonadaceae bacterium]
MAARAARGMNDDKREAQWLERALQHDGELHTARLMTEAELHVDARRFDAALESLDSLQEGGRRHIAALRLALRVHQALGRWQDVLRVTRLLEKHRAIAPEHAASLKQRAHLENIKQPRRRCRPAYRLLERPAPCRAPRIAGRGERRARPDPGRRLRRGAEDHRNTPGSELGRRTGRALRRMQARRGAGSHHPRRRLAAGAAARCATAAHPRPPVPHPATVGQGAELPGSVAGGAAHPRRPSRAGGTVRPTAARRRGRPPLPRRGSLHLAAPHFGSSSGGSRGRSYTQSFATRNSL